VALRPRAALIRLAALGLTLGAIGTPTSPADADSWGGITPGQSTLRDVQARYGRPTRERSVVDEGRTVPEWTYIGERAPAGLDRMVVSFGLLGPAGFSPDVVRAVAIYPKPRVFSLDAVTIGWGTPDAVGSDEQTGQVALRYDRRGVLVLLDPTKTWAEMILFAPAQ
jgi:hypothetical protein